MSRSSSARAEPEPAAPLLCAAPSAESAQRQRLDRAQQRMERELRSAASLFSAEVAECVARALSEGPLADSNTLGSRLRRLLPSSEVSDGVIVAMLTMTLCASPLGEEGWGGSASPAMLPTRALLGLPPLLQHHQAPTVRSSQRTLVTLAEKYQQRARLQRQAAESAARAAAAQRAQLVLAQQKEADLQRQRAAELCERARLALETATEQAALAKAYDEARRLAQSTLQRGEELRVATHRQLLEMLRRREWVTRGAPNSASAAEQRAIHLHEEAHKAAATVAVAAATAATAAATAARRR